MSDLTPPLEPPSRSADIGHFECEIRSSGREGTWICPSGELDLASAPQLRQALHEALSGARLVIVDLRRLTFMDSTGLHVFIEADAQSRRSDGRLVMVRGPSQIDRLFEMVGLSDRLEIVDRTLGLAPPAAGPDPDPVNWPSVA